MEMTKQFQNQRKERNKKLDRMFSRVKIIYWFRIIFDVSLS